MNDQKRRLRSIQIELNNIYEDLFGAKYIPGLQTTDKEEFNNVIETFRGRLFAIRQLQEQRDVKQARRGYKQKPEDIRINHEIREDIKNCQTILKEAVRRKKNDLKNKSDYVVEKIATNRQKVLKNCFQLLKDVQQTQEGGTYQPPQPLQTLQDLKHRLIQQIEDQDRIDFQDQQNFQKYKKKDMQIEEGLEEIIHENKLIKQGLKEANKMIDITGQKIKDNLVRAERIDLKIRKGTQDLEEVLVQYRKPNKLCLDVTLVLLLLALIGVIISMIKNNS